MKRIRIRFTFLLFNAVLFIFRDAGLIFEFYAVCLLHELGHLAALKLTGGELRMVELSGIGIRITASPAADIKRGAAVLLSGPAVNLLMYALLSFSGNSGRLAELSLAAGLFNLLPFSSLDGGALLDMLAEGSPHERLIQSVLKAVRIGIILILACFAVRCACISLCV